MRKNFLILSPIALLFTAFTSLAATNGQVTITANVVASTCDVSVSTNNLDLGNHAKSQFIAVRTPLAASKKQFTVGLSNCDAPGAGNTANLIVDGPVLGGNTDMFNSTGTNTGVMLSNSLTPGAYIKRGDSLLVATAGATPTAADFNNKTLTFIAGIASTSANADLGSINAPVLFSFNYN